jgi:multidrug efflux system membrane fusion protein
VNHSLAATALATALVLGGCNSVGDSSALKKPKAINKMQYPVQVARTELQQEQYTVIAPGSIEAFQQVQITARVSGAVDRVAFVEGQAVKKGDLLVLIEVERYQVAVDQAQAAMDKAQANEKAAEAELARRQGAVAAHPGLVAGEEIDQYATSVASQRADVEAARQSLRVAQLNLRDASVRAPFAGVVQSRTVQAGQYLQPGATLASLLQRDPLLLRFPVTEADAPRIKPGMTANMTLRESTRAYAASVLLVAEAADPTTRLVQVTARIDDAEHKYWLRPGAFCDVNVPVGDARPAIIVPSLSVQPTENGNVVYTVDAANLAHPRNVTLGMHTPQGGVEVTQGLRAGEDLVVRGFEPLSEGAPVNVTERITLAAATGTGDAGASNTGTNTAPLPPPRAEGSGAPAAAVSSTESPHASGHAHTPAANP